MSGNDTNEPRVAVVTGAGRGIGRAIAERLSLEGFALELTGLDGAELAETAHALSHHGPVYAASCDFRRRDELDRWLAELAARRPRIDVLVHNAGVGGPDPEDDRALLTHLDHLLEVNASAVHRITRELAPCLAEDGRGRVVIVASVLGKMGVPGFSAYCASKAAAIGLARAMALDLAKRSITVNAVCPGWTDTAMALQGFEAIAAAGDGDAARARAEVERGLPLGRIVRPDEVAGLVAFLAGPDAGAMTGQALTMSAGDLQK
ncbi:MAG: SDR family oxidoreductase [Planctomycetota bacterium]